MRKTEIIAAGHSESCHGSLERWSVCTWSSGPVIPLAWPIFEASRAAPWRSWSRKGWLWLWGYHEIKAVVNVTTHDISTCSVNANTVPLALFLHLPETDEDTGAVRVVENSYGTTIDHIIFAGALRERPFLAICLSDYLSIYLSIHLSYLQQSP